MKKIFVSAEKKLIYFINSLLFLIILVLLVPNKLNILITLDEFQLTDFINKSKDYIIQFLGAFLGAFFAFLFFLIGSWIQGKTKWKKTVKNEHAFLERYFNDVRQSILYNKGLLPKIVEDYKKKEANIMSLVLMPIREDSSMKINDQIFITKIENYIIELKRFNLSLTNLNNWKEKINIDLLDESLRSRTRGVATLENFISQANVYEKVFKYHLSEVENFTAENRILLKKYKSWKYNEEEIKKENLERKELIKKEIEIIREEDKSSPLMNDHLEKLKEYGLYQDEGNK